MLSTNIRFVSVTSGILMMESTALIHLLVILSYPGALPVGSRLIMSSMSFSVVVLKVKVSSPMSRMGYVKNIEAKVCQNDHGT